VTEEQYIAKVPELATWSPEARAQFVQGMNELNGMAITGPPGQVMDAVGLVIIDYGGPEASYVTRASVLEMAAGEEGFPAEALEQLQKPPPPGILHVLIVGGRTLRMLLEIPGKMHRVTQLGSEAN